MNTPTHTPTFRAGGPASRPPRRLPTAILAALTALIALLLLAPAASAEVPSLLTQMPEDGLAGSEAGRTERGVDVAADPNVPGNVYVTDFGSHMISTYGNDRIDEFTPWGAFVRAWGWGVADGKAEFETCTTHCQAGIVGAGAGQFDEPEAVAVDGKGHVYVRDSLNYRIQEFTTEGAFVRAWGWGVANGEEKFETCTATCEAGIAGGEPGQFEVQKYASEFGERLAVSPVTGDLFVGEGKRIQVFEPGGSFKEEIAMPAEMWSVAAGPGGDLYVSLMGGGTGDPQDRAARALHGAVPELRRGAGAAVQSGAAESVGRRCVRKRLCGDGQVLLQRRWD